MEIKTYLLALCWNSTDVPLRPQYCVHVMHRKQGSKYIHQWDLCEAECISLDIEVLRME